MSTLTDATPAERHALVSAHFLDLAETVSDWSAPTPVKEWVAKDVVAHLGWLPGMLAGMGVHLEVPALAEDPVVRFRAQSLAVQALLEGPGADRVLETSWFGTRPLSWIVDNFYTFDVFAHGWDLARSSGQDSALDEDYAEQARAGMAAMGASLQESGQFGTPQAVADDAPAAERLMALLGRDPNWAPSGTTA